LPTLNWLRRGNDLKTSWIASCRLLEALPELSYGEAEADK